jgi:hypothetical protein
MADANARLERLRRRNAVRGQTEPIFRRQHVSAEEEEEEDLESSYLPSGHIEPSLSFTATATSHAHSRSQMSRAQALAMAQELLRYQPTTDGCEGWRARVPSSSPSPTKTRPREEPRARENQIRRRGTAPRASEMGRPPRPRR